MSLSSSSAPIDAKELLESVEFLLKTRARVIPKHSPPHTLYDVACGHGLTGLLFAALHPSLRVVLCDARRPSSFAPLLAAVAAVRPHVRSSVTYVESPLSALPPPPGSSAVIAVHACGSLTDAALAFAADVSASTAAVMPCCYTGTAAGAPAGARRMLGVGLAADLERAYRMEARGFRTDFSAIAEEITPMNRILVAERRGGGHAVK
ncbi:hypothetical protein TeGR_g8480 [Tetraparma gracilis]|uniref:Methyltransferase domain-containing protein n=1 Tax=Tetraparma gracilis TaxID=2962635 RepID=A0ABQ6MFS3_9STRA|nr:hypothetical protein TeGR_g8480 [Tetraparma gracilis]